MISDNERHSLRKAVQIVQTSSARQQSSLRSLSNAQTSSASNHAVINNELDSFFIYYIFNTYTKYIPHKTHVHFVHAVSITNHQFCQLFASFKTTTTTREGSSMIGLACWMSVSLWMYIVHDRFNCWAQSQIQYKQWREESTMSAADRLSWPNGFLLLNLKSIKLKQEKTIIVNPKINI